MKQLSLFFILILSANCYADTQLPYADKVLVIKNERKMSDKEIEEIWKLVKNGTPIEILP